VRNQKFKTKHLLGFIQDIVNFKCCEPTRYPISETQCCTDLYFLENDGCYINALVPTGIVLGGAGIARDIIDQSKGARIYQSYAFSTTVSYSYTTHSSSHMFKLPQRLMERSQRRPVLGLTNRESLLAPLPVALLLLLQY
jgi:hypothetical protein